MHQNTLFSLSGDILQQLCVRGKNGVGGGLLVCGGARRNVMTIGWGTLGSMWNKLVMVVPVRDSRYSLELMEECDEFTVNLFADSQSERATQLLKLCGTTSGRDQDKFAVGKIQTLPAQIVSVPTLAECTYIVECRTLYRQRMQPHALCAPLEAACYADQNYHTFFYGEILAAYRR